MAASMPSSARSRSADFQSVTNAFLAGEGLPFAEILSAERIRQVFGKQERLFGQRGVYNTAIMVWSFLSQVLRDGKDSACQSAVARVAAYCQQPGLKVPTRDTGDYCRARAKLSPEGLQERSGAVGADLENAAPSDWLFQGKHHATLVDGFTFTMPDTPANQAQYPQLKAQTPGVGFPIARATALISLATGCVRDVALGPYQGKETGETALLRALLGSFTPGEIAVMDRYYCSFMMIALLLRRGIQVCARKHQGRHGDFRRGRRLGRHDHLIVWTRPQRPTWMDEATYEQMPATLVLRELRYHIVEPGKRTQVIDIITTLTDPEQHPAAAIAELYGFRWNAEWDIRAIKSNLNLGHVRCKSPALVQAELWATIWAYNLIRATAAGAALLHDQRPRQINFTSTDQYVLAGWVDDVIDRPTPRRRLGCLPAPDAQTDRRRRRRRPPRPLGAARPQTPPPRLQIHDATPTRA